MGNSHAHTHSVINPEIVASERGIWAVKWSFIGLMVTALLQMGIVLISGSVALLADSIHNLGDAATAIPLWVAFVLAQWKPNQRFTYGYRRVEDLAGVVIIGIILLSALVTGYESIERFLHPQPISYLGSVMVAAIIGFLGNEAVARFRLKIGQEINSAALVADGYHARIDSLTSLSVFFGAALTGLGYPLADPLVGLLITIAIARIFIKSAQTVLTRLLDGVEAEVIEAIYHALDHVPEILEVRRVKARWTGHFLQTEIAIAVNPELSLVEADAIALDVVKKLRDHTSYLAEPTVSVEPY
ncbi:cation diffusion facilitator family transporter [Gloeocapsa sp. PCC 73106]|uniref:cation diffusion facilitator family transporter n=1 Tax=Gloeocapsa sp. PCC 73106 TaxID=102232 RepID=UPI0002ACE8A0|nr:cation diffusion facilitator family transporter [Gloeocapsa sp. PCC 73106]ELR96420.1 cation diffusion facilitator family transporter [Gloeocapsa sp. PCC 73106]